MVVVYIHDHMDSGESSAGPTLATLRAYRADLRDVRKWASSHGIDARMQFEDAHIAAYFAQLIGGGMLASTLRRRASALRFAQRPDSAMLLGEPVIATDADTQAIERSAVAALRHRTTVLVAVHDPILRAGLIATLADAGIFCWGGEPTGLPAAGVSSWDYLIVWLDQQDGIDRHAGIEVVRGLGVVTTTRVPVIGVVRQRPNPYLRLRMAEAGVRYAVSHAWLSANIGVLPRLLVESDIPDRYHLESPIALRARVGMALGGDVGAFLDEARTLPRAAWESTRSRSALGIRRADVEQLRRLSAQVAGVRPPPERPYASPSRSGPLLPTWASIQTVVRRSFGVPAVRQG